MVNAKAAGTNHGPGRWLVAELTHLPTSPHGLGGDRRPGFINFKLDDGCCATRWRAAEEGERLPRPDVGHGERVQVVHFGQPETGPIHVGTVVGRSYGDALARVLDRAAYR